uniref:Ribosomal protein L22 n=1 Tax=Romanomermis culicivorax TaxID=13658 RepID=A0A915L498_ROMCU
MNAKITINVVSIKKYFFHFTVKNTITAEKEHYQNNEQFQKLKVKDLTSRAEKSIIVHDLCKYVWRRKAKRSVITKSIGVYPSPKGGTLKIIHVAKKRLNRNKGRRASLAESVLHIKAFRLDQHVD